MRIDFRVYLVTDRTQAKDGDIMAAVAAALDGGIRAIQLREKDLGGRDLFRLAEAMRRLTARYAARLLVNDRVDVAYAAGADGVHLGGGSIPVGDARALMGSRALIGRSAHTIDDLAAAERDGADFATFGPVYATPSKAAYGPPVGVPALAAACAAAKIPVFALGGVGPANMNEALRAGAFGIALVSAVVAAADPRAAAMELAARFAPGR